MSFIIMEASTNRSRSGWSRAYRRLAVVEIDDVYFAVERMRAALVDGKPGPTQPKQIRPRAKGMRRIVKTWEHLNKGLTARSAYYVALREAKALCMALNAEEAHAHYYFAERLNRDFD